MRINIYYKILIILGIIYFSVSAINYGQHIYDGLFELRLGTSNVIFQDVDPKDGQAAFIVYTKKIEKRISEKRGFNTTLKYHNYNTIDEIKKALRLNEIDVLSITTDQYFELVPEFELELFTAASQLNGIFTQYALIGNKSVGSSIDKFAGKRIDIPSVFNGFIPIKWLTLILKENIENYFRVVNFPETESSSIYNVFFGKSDCAIVRKSVLTTICELNPQLKNSIVEIELSPQILPSLLVYVKNADKKLLDLVLKESKELHLSDEGRTILKIFKATKIVEINKSDLESVKSIVNNYKNYIQNKKRSKKQ